MGRALHPDFPRDRRRDRARNQGDPRRPHPLQPGFAAALQFLAFGRRRVHRAGAPRAVPGHARHDRQVQGAVGYAKYHLAALSALRARSRRSRRPADARASARYSGGAGQRKRHGGRRDEGHDRHLRRGAGRALERDFGCGDPRARKPGRRLGAALPGQPDGNAEPSRPRADRSHPQDLRQRAHRAHPAGG